MTNASRRTRSVALFLPTLRGGGAERNMLRLARGLAERGYPVFVIVADARGPYRKLVPETVELVDFGVRFLPTSVWPMARWLRRNRPGVVLSAINGANVVALAARRLARVDVPIVVSERNTLSEWRTDLLSIQRRWFIPWLVRRLYPSADRILAVSRSTADDLASFLALPRERVLVVANPVVGAELTSLAGEPVPPEWRKFVGQRPLVIAVGRLVPQKDPTTLVRAFASVHRQIPDAVLALVGDGPLWPQVERLAHRLDLGDSVVFPGFQDNPYAWMARADVLALTSRYEGLPTVLIEALACGARVVATDSPGGAAEILEGGRWGRLVGVGDVDACAAAIIEMLRVGRWRGVPEDAVARFEFERVVTDYQRVLDPLLERT